MAASRQSLRSRIKSVKSTKKITKAMEMIANAKLFRSRNKMESNRTYAGFLQETVDEIVANNRDVESQFLVPQTSQKTFTLVYCSDLGLCGGYNQNVIKLARTLNKQDPIYLVGTSLYGQMRNEGFNLLNEQPVSSDQMTFDDLRKIVEMGVHLYQDKQVGIVQILYTQFVNTMTFSPAFDQLLPCRFEQKEKKQQQQETLFEPDPSTILDELIPMMLNDVAYADWMESTTAEQGSRRVAMKTASDNADELAETLTLAYNKARQAAITQEITEIVGGSSAV